MHFHNILFKIDNFTFIVLTIAVSVGDLGMSLGSLSLEKHRKKSGHFFSKLHRNPALGK